MPSNEQIAHDLAMFHVRVMYERFEQEHQQRQEVRGVIGTFTFDSVTVYQEGYKAVLAQLKGSSE